jgi:hypothetical protein
MLFEQAKCILLKKDRLSKTVSKAFNSMIKEREVN